MAGAREEGEHNKALEIAKKLILSGMSMKQICIVTGLAEEQIEKLIN